MLSIILSLALRISTPATCAPPADLPELSMPAPEWAFIPVRTSTCRPSSGVAALMYAVDIDPIEETKSGERTDLDIYAEGDL